MIRRENQTQKRRNAFTLLEILIVVTIIVILAGMGGIYFMGQFNEAKKDTTKIHCKKLTEAVDLYEMRNGAGSVTDLNILKVGTDNQSPVLGKDVPLTDPWGNPYQIMRESNGQVYVQSQGPPGGQPIH